MVILSHTGGGPWGSTPEAARPAIFSALAEVYPRITIIMAHCGVFGGSDQFEEAVKAAEEHSNIYLETTGTLGQVSVAQWQGAIKRVGADRVIYGNDYPWVSEKSVKEELKFIGSLGFSEPDRQKILGDNIKGIIFRTR
jgi:predicted TIM-barrel fold metal-dependent hydrolase